MSEVAPFAAEEIGNMLKNRLDSLFSNWKSSKNRNQGQLDLFLISVDMKGNNIICITISAFQI